MIRSDGALAYRRLRPPDEDGAAGLEPPAAEIPALLDRNIVLREQTAHCDILGCSLSRLRDAARHNLLRQATAYTTGYRDVSLGDPGPEAPVVISGHQPRLVHPGVWFKNFLLFEFARRMSAHAINLVIDNDLVGSTALHVPSGSANEPTLSLIGIDAPTERIPYEERAIQDHALFASFGQRVETTISQLVEHPVVRDLWPYAVESARRHDNVGQALAQARHRLEGDWGLHTLELPLSAVCDHWSFAWFAACLLSDPQRLRRIYNDCVAEYRHRHKIRSRTRPVPALAGDTGWIEVPFWLWTTEQPTRSPAFVRRRGRHTVLSDKRNIRIALPLTPDADATHCVEQLESARRNGIRLRPRALITTMFARLVLSDLFLHGIGGAKYDQVSDAIARRYFDIELPEYATATATLKLPVPRPRVASQDLQRVKQLLRELHYHPEWHVDVTPETVALIAEKRRWIAAEPPPDRLHERHRGIVRVNAALRDRLGRRRNQLLEEQVMLRSLLKKKAILDSREYAFCLFPGESLRNRLLDLSRQ